MNKLVVCKYIIFENGELSFSSQKYPYLIDTLKSVEEGHFIVIKDYNDRNNSDRNNSDNKAVSVVKVVKSFTDPESDEAHNYLETCIRSPIDKVFLGKADIAPYFEEIEKKHERAELKKKIEARFKEAEKEALYKKLAETDPIMKSLLSELEALNM